MGKAGRWTIVRDLLVFQTKLAMDGMKDLVLSPLSLLAALVDLVFPGQKPGHRFYSVLGVGERFDRWLCLFPAAEQIGDVDSDFVRSSLH